MKTLEQLLQADPKHNRAMTAFVFNHEYVAELYNGITEKFDNPILLVAVNKRISVTADRVLASENLLHGGYTYDDAFKLNAHYSGGNHE